MPERKYSPSSGSRLYRYGFNGKENDNEVKGEGNQQDYGMRFYDPRLGKFLSVDPIAKDYPELTTYQFASNSPVYLIDIDGLEGGSPRIPEEDVRERERESDPATGGRGPRTPGGRLGQEAGDALREGNRIYEELENANAVRRQILAGTYEEITARANKLGNMASNYLMRVWTSAQYTFGGEQTSLGGAVLINKSNGNIFEKEVFKVMMQNPDYIKVVKQVTFKVESINGNSIKIRVDNVGVTFNNQLDFGEAKFSIYEITESNVSRTLTLNQKDFFTMLINGQVASIKFVGGPAKEALLGHLSGTEVLGDIRDIKIYTPMNPLSPATTSNSSTSINANTNTNSTTNSNSNNSSSNSTIKQNNH